MEIHATADGPWDFRFSNFAPVLIQDDYGIVYPSVEHAYQAQKTVDLTLRREIANLVKPGDAKRRGAALPLRPNWEGVKLAIMLHCLTQKFRARDLQTTQYAQRLIETGTTPLCETNHWHDDYWGHCICSEHAMLQGANWLGRLLMLRRSQLYTEDWTFAERV
jgi:ribA/ribD-fused uncharacterized protein